MRSRLAVAAVLLAGTALLGGCSTTVHLEPAADANDPLCADVIVSLQNTKTLAGQDRRWTDAQATAAWGTDSSAILLTCGLEKPAPTSDLQCVTLEGVDWLVDASETPYVRLTTYGREPAVQMYVDTEAVSSNDVISNRGIVGAITSIPAESACTAPDQLPEDYEADAED
ncbi:DUF3515 domain-containing protein [Microbacterium sp. M28]|uniref:DUF3515 domain-containing protein n=1 Tax=Microbacterium sp. M28 TaxID=2962064 RepID=UPI0021F402DD|nr:DUF3515 domain-containing protein [Microbacterium sp. M28]UYO98431.1 DUF3515 domain-containing protein [Microbacterium sp. M28]